WPSDLPKQRTARVHELGSLARVLGIRLSEIAADIRKHRGDPLTPVNVKDNVGEGQVLYLKERQQDFPGVQIAPAYLRSYPHGELAAQVLGYVGEVSAQELKTLRKQGYHPGDVI